MATLLNQGVNANKKPDFGAYKPVPKGTITVPKTTVPSQVPSLLYSQQAAAPINWNAYQDQGGGARLQVPPGTAPQPITWEQLKMQELQAAGATQKQAGEVLGAMTSGNVNSQGVPNNMNSIMGLSAMPSPESAIPVSSLSMNSSQSLNDMLGASVGSGGGASTVAGLLNLLNEVSPEEKAFNETATMLTNLQQQLGGQSQDYQSALQELGVPESFQQIRDLNLQAAQLKGELDQFDIETERGMGEIENQPVTAHVVYGQQARLQKQRDLTRMSKAAQLSATIGLMEAYQGNIDTGMRLAKEAIDIKYAPLLNNIEVVKTQLGIAEKTLDRSDKKRGTIINTLLKFQEDEIAMQRDQEMQVEEMAIQAALAGAPVSIVQAARATGDPLQAATMLSAYVHATGEKGLSGASGGGGGGGGSSSTGTLSKSDFQTGAARSGLSSQGFKSLPFDVQNFFANGSAADVNFLNEELAFIDSGQETKQELEEWIKTAGLPDYMDNYLRARASGLPAAPQKKPSIAQRAGSAIGAAAKKVTNFVGNAWNSLFD